MPTTYTHYRFGKDVLNKLPDNKQVLINKYRELYDIGLHGPDILFYYKALSHNFVNGYGGQLHNESGKQFFRHAGMTLRMHDIREEDLAYLYGFICHFVLDACCHGYIRQKEKSGITHAEIESEFDRFLLVMDEKDPLRTVLTSHLHPTMENANVIAPYFVGITPEQVKTSVRSMITYHDLLRSPGKLKRNTLLLGLRLTGHYEGMHGLFINYEPNPDCEDSNTMLWSLYNEAIDKAVECINHYLDIIDNNTSWDDIYKYNFEGEIIEGK